MRQYKKYLPHLLVGGTAAGLAWWWWKNSQATVCPAAPALQQAQQRVEYAPGSEPRGAMVDSVMRSVLERRGKDGAVLPPMGMPQSDLIVPRGNDAESLSRAELPQWIRDAIRAQQAQPDPRGRPVDFLPPVGMPQSDLTPLQIAQAMLTAAEQQAADPTLDADAHAAAIAMQPALRAKVAALSNPAAQI